MSGNDEQRSLLNKQLLAAARQQGNVDELLSNPEHRDPEDEDSFLFDINCIDVLGNTPLHLAVLSGSLENVDALITSDAGCDVDPQNFQGDTPLHLAVQIQDPETRRGIVGALVDAGADHSIKLTNKAGQTPKDLCNIYCPDDAEVISRTTPALRVRKMEAVIDLDDIASDDGGSDSE
ncbi:hypothetical protein PAXINDRAFT_100515 [Paxillus involutus ATCC 200175]|uniref:Uncharacterized protein n=1 Tax=Paxillus involutus ATCC 200175 TaxID=664439 RepID=A0A0C9U3G5_PAXIN|nr:hypothetical protein PAXINDRAFT_100515 [Paxillus involutus ATCC 200175]